MAPSHACCTVPPVEGDQYKEKGQFDQIAGMKTYGTGKSDAKTGILVVYDIFGFFPQTLQGADILATGDKDHQKQVFIPDFFDGKPYPIKDFPADTDEKKEKFNAFFGGPAAPPKTLERIPKVIKELESKHPNIKQWGLVGFCWGGKIVNLASQSGTTFKAAVVAHPAMVDPKDAEGITIPFALLASKDEPKEDVEKWQKAIKVKNQVEFFDDIHGFMAARADLKDESAKKNYEKGYKIALDFFHENLA